MIKKEIVITYRESKQPKEVLYCCDYPRITEPFYTFYLTPEETLSIRLDTIERAEIKEMWKKPDSFPIQFTKPSTDKPIGYEL